MVVLQSVQIRKNKPFPAFSWSDTGHLIFSLLLSLKKKLIHVLNDTSLKTNL